MNLSVIIKTMRRFWFFQKISASLSDKKIECLVIVLIVLLGHIERPRTIVCVQPISFWGPMIPFFSFLIIMNPKRAVNVT